MVSLITSTRRGWREEGLEDRGGDCNGWLGPCQNAGDSFVVVGIGTTVEIASCACTVEQCPGLPASIQKTGNSENGPMI